VLKIWLMAIRPKTLWLSVAPIAMASAIAYSDEKFHLLSALGCLLMAVLVQIGTNFTNDYYDYFKGADDEDRKGPIRVTQAGLVKPGTMRKAMGLVFTATFLVGMLLMLRGGWPMVAICVVSILAGYMYTGGPYPLGYNGLGDIFVLIFFGPVAVTGTYYVQTLELQPYVFIAGLAPGLFSTAVLAVNNLRDADGDARCGKRTLAVRFGKSFAKWEYLLCLVVGCLIPVVLNVYYGFSPFVMLAILIAPLALPLLKTIWREEGGKVLNNALAGTAKLLNIYTLLFSIGIFL
jgi:1,4-dihydroxy-2-naphthoate octaprenyltransferase